MKRVRLLAGITAVIPAAAAGAAVPTAAQATPAAQTHAAAAGTTSAAGKQVVLGAQAANQPYRPRWVEIYGSPKVVYYRSGQERKFYQGVSVYVTCYYSNPRAPYADKYWDHFTYLRIFLKSSRISGHTADEFVNLSGRLPVSASLRHC